MAQEKRDASKNHKGHEHYGYCEHCVRADEPSDSRKCYACISAYYKTGEFPNWEPRTEVTP